MIAVASTGAPDGARFALVAVDRERRRARARAALRALLADIDPRGELAETPRGPVGIGAWARIGCSIAYAQDAALVAIAPGWAIGIDVVAVALPPEWRDLARTYCAPGTDAAIARAAAADRARVFAHAWARCEADAKCLGLPLTEHAPSAAAAGLLRVPLDVPGLAAAATLRPLASESAAPAAR